MNNILKQIVEKKRKDLALQKQNRFIDLFNNELVVIGEIKLASPTISYFGSDKNIIKRAVTYKNSGINIISIITEKHFFKGNIEFISQIKNKVDLPILQKDFIIDAYQIYESKIIGANALLLIAKIVNQKTLKKFVSLCQEIGLEPVVEISDEVDLKKALITSTKIIAVNARNLKTFKVDVDVACLLIKKISNKFIKLGFSGIKSSGEVIKYQDAGADGVLVGTSLMKTENIKSFIKELTTLNVKVKICGIRTLDAAQTAVEAGADFLGFNFVKSSKRYIKPELAKKIISQLKGKAKIVGVFENAETNYINRIVNLLGLDFIQLHEKRIIKSTKDNTSYLLVDRKTQGVGKLPNLNKSEALAKSAEIFFAGGLTPENVSSIVKTVKPYAVDVAGGIETNGFQDLNKIKEFIKKVKETII